MKSITDRLRRVSGQIKSIEEAIANDTPCNEVVPQLLAIKGAINGTLQAYLETSLDSCIDTSDEERMKDLIKVLLKHS